MSCDHLPILGEAISRQPVLLPMSPLVSKFVEDRCVQDKDNDKMSKVIATDKVQTYDGRHLMLF